MFCPDLVLQFYISFLVLQKSLWDRISWLLYLQCNVPSYMSVFVFVCMPLPHSGMGWSDICNCCHTKFLIAHLWAISLRWAFVILWFPLFVGSIIFHLSLVIPLSTIYSKDLLLTLMVEFYQTLQKLHSYFDGSLSKSLNDFNFIRHCGCQGSQKEKKSLYLSNKYWQNLKIIWHKWSWSSINIVLIILTRQNNVIGVNIFLYICKKSWNASFSKTTGQA